MRGRCKEIRCDHVEENYFEEDVYKYPIESDGRPAYLVLCEDCREDLVTMYNCGFLDKYEETEVQRTN